jgi:hypothetical protein
VLKPSQKIIMPAKKIAEIVLKTCLGENIVSKTWEYMGHQGEGRNERSFQGVSEDRPEIDSFRTKKHRLKLSTLFELN